jgi:hypothetical protein
MNESAKVLPITETTEIESKALALPEKARLIVVDSNEGMTMADNTVKDLDAMLKEIDGTFKPIADKAFQAHRAVTGKWKEIKQPLEDAKLYLVNQVKTYQRKIKEAAEAEARRLAEKARQDEEERLLLEAEQAEKEGNHEEAEAILEAPVYVAPVIIKPDIPKVDNRKYAIKWKARVVDKMAVIKFVAANPMFADLLSINESVANQKARSMGKEMKIPGLVSVEE